MTKIKVRLTADSIDSAIHQLTEYQNKVKDLGDKIARELAYMGYEVAHGIISGHVWSGETLGNLDVIEDGEGRYILRTESKAILFFEFGAGIRYGAGHPMPGNYGPGTYPGKGHWDDPNGWWFETDDPRLIKYTSKKTGKSYGHSYGNPPRMPFYLADQKIKDSILKVAKEALQS